jgi:hypothetical protein
MPLVMCYSLIFPYLITQDGIQRVLLALSVHLSRQMTVQDKCRAMVPYNVLVHLLLKDFQTGLGGCTSFVLREVIHVLMSVIYDSAVLELVTLHFFFQIAALPVIELTKVSCKCNEH